MAITKKRKDANKKVDATKAYTLKDASTLVKDANTCKFDASVDLHVRLGVDPKKADQAVRGTVTLPHGTGKTKRVLVLCPADKEAEAQASGADFVGLDEFIQKIEGGWTDVDVIIATPSVMPRIGRLGKVLGPKGLMPNPKLGTVTMNVAEAVKAAKGGQIEYRVEKAGIIHSGIGKASFPAEDLRANFDALVDAVVKAKPSGAKGKDVRKVAISSTMGAGIKVDTAEVAAI